MTTTRERPRFRRILPVRAANVDVDCTIAHITGPTVACATCELNKLRDQSKPARPAWVQACVIALAVALPIMALLITGLIVLQ